MDIHRFNAEVRSHLTTIPIGKQGIALDRIDLDKSVDHYERFKGRPGAPIVRSKLWDANDLLDH